MTTAITLYAAATLCAALVAAFGLFSLRYYANAKRIAPHLIELEELKRRIAEAQSTLAGVHAEIKAMDDALANANRCIVDGEAAKKWLEENGTKIEALRIAESTARQHLKTAEEAYLNRQKELDELTQRVADAHRELKDSAIKRDHAEVAKSRLEEEAKSLRVMSDLLAKEKTAIEGEIKSLEGKRAEFEAKVRGLEKEADRLKQQIADGKAEATAHNQAVAAAKKELAELDGRANVARKVLSEYAAYRTSDDECWADLDAPLVPPEKLLPFTVQKPGSIDEKRWLEEFQLDLKNCGIVFNKRTIMAFHTSLKCADISPLVVLAGISGTGKSLLPELYAAALGMNFLPVSVQPRWDGPQDMFGFYNYMEGRYKATELSRLLWQFDKYNNPEGCKKLQGFPMNLVLLDEMNLARVEYYFSDMLSKLEIRRGLDFDKDESRAKAEMEIESSASAAAKQRRRLFIAPNTLFVGTMNEDETTQSLSDKVLDRANVLRFGRPEKLGAKPDKKEFLAKTADKPVITESIWKTWSSPPSSGTATERLKRVLEPLNVALGKAGRPFAHRVWEAMETYIRNYPGSTGSNHASNNALADQIEMKVLPKLNGIELDAPGFGDARRELSQVIDGLGDEKLRESFEASCDTAHNSFFKWRGVMR